MAPVPVNFEAARQLAEDHRDLLIRRLTELQTSIAAKREGVRRRHVPDALLLPFQQELDREIANDARCIALRGDIAWYMSWANLYFQRASLTQGVKTNHLLTEVVDLLRILTQPKES